MDARGAVEGEWMPWEQREGSGRYGSSERGVDARGAVGREWTLGEQGEGSGR